MIGGGLDGVTGIQGVRTAVGWPSSLQPGQSMNARTVMTRAIASKDL